MHVKSLMEALFPSYVTSKSTHLSRGRKLRELCTSSQMFLPESHPHHSTDISWAKDPSWGVNAATTVQGAGPVLPPRCHMSLQLTGGFTVSNEIC